MDWFTLGFSVLIALPFILGGRGWGRDARVRRDAARLLSAGAGRPLEEELASRPGGRAAGWMGWGLLAGGLLAQLPLPAALGVFPPLWLPLALSTVGYVVGWRSAQAEAVRAARARGPVEADMTPRSIRRYLPVPRLLVPWTLIAAATALVALLGAGALGKRAEQLGGGATVEVTWPALLAGLGLAALVAALDLGLMREIALAPRALPTGAEPALATATEDLIRADSLNHTLAGSVSTVAFVLAQPLALIALAPGGPIWLLLVAPLVTLLGLAVVPTLVGGAFGRLGWGAFQRRSSR